MTHFLALVAAVVAFLSSLAAGQFFGLGLLIATAIGAIFGLTTGLVVRFTVRGGPRSQWKPGRGVILSACLAVYMALFGMWTALYSTSRWATLLAAAAFFVAALNCWMAIAYKILSGPSR
jgi:hypothetical protein